MRRLTVRLGVVLLIPYGWDYFVYHGILFQAVENKAIPVRSI